MRSVVLVLLLAIILLASGCTRAHHTLIYSPHEPVAMQPKYPIRVAVTPFTDERKAKNTEHWPLGFLPLVFYQTNRLHRPDEFIRANPYALIYGLPTKDSRQIYYTQEFAKAIAADLQNSMLFTNVEYVDSLRDAHSYDAVIKGTLKKTYVRADSFNFGATWIVQWFLMGLGCPNQTPRRFILDAELELVPTGEAEVVYQRRLEKTELLGLGHMFMVPFAVSYYGDAFLVNRGGDAYTCYFRGYLREAMGEAILDMDQKLAQSEQMDSLVARARTRPAPVAPPPEPPSVSDPGMIRNAYAVVVGVSQYRHAGGKDLTDLAYADDDARAFRDALLKSGWGADHIRCLVDAEATKAGVEDALKGWLRKGKDALVVLYWSGHGYPDPADTRKVYFACHDTDLSRPYSGWRMDDVADAIKEVNPRNVVVIADTCHAGKIVTKGDERGMSVVGYVERQEQERQVPRGWIYMVSAEADRRAIEHTSWANGAFTHCLLNGLSGGADTDRDGQITMLELKAFMSDTMPRETERVLGAPKHPLIVTDSVDPKIWNLSLAYPRP